MGSITAFIAQIYNNPFLSIETDLPVIGSIKLYPNPSMGDITLEFYSMNNAEDNIEIYSHLGQLLNIQKIEINEGKNIFKVSCLDLSDGIYFLKLTKGNASGKFIIIK